MGGAFNLGKLFGIQVRIHFTWFIIFALVTVTLSWQVFPGMYPGWEQSLYWVMGVASSLLFFASVIAHEFAHSLVAMRKGVPVKSITLFVFGGVAQITKEAAKASDELKIAAAGPVCSVAIGGLFFLLSVVVRSISAPVAVMAFWLAQINVVLAVFNMIPGFPLDGGRIFRSTLWRFTGSYQHSTRIATQVGKGVAYSFMGVGGVVVFLFDQWLSGMWLVFIGFFLLNAASTAYRQQQWRDSLRGVTAVQVMTTGYPVVSPETTVGQLIRDYILAGGYRFFLVVDEGRLQGILTLSEIRSVSQQAWESTQAGEIMTPVDRLKAAQPDQDVLSILGEMDEGNIDQMPVVSEGRVIGVIARDSLARFLYNRPASGVPFAR